MQIWLSQIFGQHSRGNENYNNFVSVKKIFSQCWNVYLTNQFRHRYILKYACQKIVHSSLSFVIRFTYIGTLSWRELDGGNKNQRCTYTLDREPRMDWQLKIKDTYDNDGNIRVSMNTKITKANIKTERWVEGMMLKMLEEWYYYQVIKDSPSNWNIIHYTELFYSHQSFSLLPPPLSVNWGAWSSLKFHLHQHL